MVSSALSPEQSTATATAKSSLIQGLNFDRLMTVLVCWFIGGLFIDGWAHNHGLVDRTFFTPWHAILYSGYAANAVVLIIVVMRNHARGYGWRASIPSGYELTLLGVPLFAVGGVGDMIWHILFGFEVGIEPLLSPTHLVLALSGILIMSGPLRAALRRDIPRRAQGWATLLPAVLSLLAVFSVFTFFTSFAHPYVESWTLFAYGNEGKTLGATSVLLQAGIMMGFVLLAIRRWRLPFGALTLLFTANAALMSVFQDSYLLIPTAALAGILADLLYWWLQPSTTPKRTESLRIFAFAVPFVYYLCYFVPVIIYNGGITWSIHLWLGSTFMAGIAGLVLSYLMVAPRSAITSPE